MIFEAFKSDTYSDGTIETTGMGTIDTFEISYQSPVSGGILIELTLGTEINGYVKKAMIRVKVN